MSSQIPLIPISDDEALQAAYRIVQTLSDIDEEMDDWKERGKAHKENLAMYHKTIDADRAIIRRQQLERAEGVTAAQMDVLFAQTTEREDT
jgi:hypothetical protein